MRHEIKDRIKRTKETIEEKRRREAERLRQEKKEQEELVEMQKQQDQLKNTSIKQMIRNREKEAEERRRRDYAEKQAKARSNLDEKVLRENQRRMEHEKMVAKMEQEELELIQRLQNTQCIQKSAYENLEQALAGEDIDMEHFESLENATSKKTKGKKKRAAA